MTVVLPYDHMFLAILVTQTILILCKGHKQ